VRQPARVVALFDLRRERVAVAVDRANDRRGVVVADGLPEFADDFGETGVGYEHAGPDALEELLFRQRARPVFDEQREQLERFRG
jgi:hypothetical protein